MPGIVNAAGILPSLQLAAGPDIKYVSTNPVVEQDAVHASNTTGQDDEIARRQFKKPALRIRPRRPGDFLDILGYGEQLLPTETKQPKLDDYLRAGTNFAYATWRKWSASDPAPDTTPQEISDPFEDINRLTFDFNAGLMEHVLEPVADYYMDNTTPGTRDGVRNFFSNLREPLSIASYAMEGDVEQAGNATARFAINTTVGVAGVYDKATEFGFPNRPRDLEATACAYGVPSGPYIVLPVLGPATLRDAVVRLTTMAIYLEAMGLAVYVPYRGSSVAAKYTDIRDKQDYIEAISLDPYVAYRTLYTKMRRQSCGHAEGDEAYFVR